jgi:KaiC/GvpD/RAD55 family RecA-like ATPase
MSKFVRITEGVADKGKLFPISKLNEYIGRTDRDYYHSVFYYDDKQLEEFKAKGSIKGIKDVKTDKLVFDFDSKDNPDIARQEALETITRLRSYGIKDKDIEIYFSGNKGFNLTITLPKEITPEQAASIALKKIGKGLKTLDPTMYDAPQLIRIPGTRHQKSGLFKIPLKVSELESSTLDEIKSKAKSLDNIKEDFEWETVTPNNSFYDIPKEEPTVKAEPPKDLDFTKMPSGWKSYKWAILQGHFESGERHHALMVLAATCRGLGYDKETAYYLCKSALKKQAERTGSSEFPKEELWDNIIEQSVYSPTWEGGQYSPENDPWLASYCKRLGLETTTDNPVIPITDAFSLFKDYAKNIDDLTVTTGIKPIDDKLRMTIGMVVGIVAGPGVGKTSMAIQLLNHMSNNNQQCVFFSYDMYHALVFQKLVQKHFGISQDELFEKFKNDDKEFEAKVLAKLSEEYKNVEFCFKQGQTPKDIVETIKYTEQKTGKKVRFVVIDYNELVLTDMSDPTAASAQVSHKLREIANSLNICVLTLLQPNKISGSPADEITSYRSAKGSSAIEQTMSVMLGVSRPGYNPKKPEDDQFITFNALKVRMGGLFSVDLHWDGLTGNIRQMTMEEKSLLADIRERKKMESETQGSWN